MGIPKDFQKALSAKKAAKAQWDKLTPIGRRDFVSWIESAKREDTRVRRIEVACSKLMAGQRRPCCYAIVPMGFYKALDADEKAKAQWKSLTPDQRRDFIDWVEEPKNAVERAERTSKACALLTKGKTRP